MQTNTTDIKLKSTCKANTCANSIKVDVKIHAKKRAANAKLSKP